MFSAGVKGESKGGGEGNKAGRVGLYIKVRGADILPVRQLCYSYFCARGNMKVSEQGSKTGEGGKRSNLEKSRRALRTYIMYLYI